MAQLITVTHDDGTTTHTTITTQELTTLTPKKLARRVITNPTTADIDLFAELQTQHTGGAA